MSSDTSDRHHRQRFTRDKNYGGFQKITFEQRELFLIVSFSNLKNFCQRIRLE